MVRQVPSSFSHPGRHAPARGSFAGRRVPARGSFAGRRFSVRGSSAGRRVPAGGFSLGRRVPAGGFSVDVRGSSTRFRCQGRAPATIQLTRHDMLSLILGLANEPLSLNCRRHNERANLLAVADAEWAASSWLALGPAPPAAHAVSSAVVQVAGHCLRDRILFLALACDGIGIGVERSGRDGIGPGSLPGRVPARELAAARAPRAPLPYAVHGARFARVLRRLL